MYSVLPYSFVRAFRQAFRLVRYADASETKGDGHGADRDLPPRAEIPDHRRRVPRSRVDALENEVKSLKVAVRQMGERVSQLEKAN